MKKLLSISLMMAVGVCVTAAFAAEEKDKDHETIEMVMKVAMKGGLCKKVADGEASDEEKAKLVELFTAMGKTKPPKGEAESWEAKTKALVVAAKAVAAGEDGAAAKLKAAANCGACHKEHKPA